MKCVLRKKGTRFLVIAVGFLAGLLVVSGAAWAAVGNLLWQDEFDLAGGDDVAVDVAADQGWVVAVGRAQSEDGDDDFVVRGYDGSSGDLLWEDEFDLAGGDDAAVAVAADQGRVVAVGRAQSEDGDDDFVVRGYDGSSGDLLWQDQFDLAGGDDRAVDVATGQGRVVVVGTGSNSVVLVRTYEPKTGELLWEDQLDGGSASGVAIHGYGVFVSGTNSVSPPTLLLSAYAVNSGELLWESVEPSTARGLAVAAAGQRVIAVGQGGAFPDDFLIRSHDAKTGELIWEDRTFVTTGFENAAVAVDDQGQRAFAVGWVRAIPGMFNQEAFLVRAYDVKTGSLLWEDQFVPGICLCHAQDVVVASGQVFVVGSDPSGTFYVRAYHPRTGLVHWEDEFDAGASVGGAAVAAEQGRVFVVGSGDSNFFIRAYEALRERGSCGTGFELALVLPGLMWLRRRRPRIARY